MILAFPDRDFVIGKAFYVNDCIDVHAYYFVKILPQNVLVFTALYGMSTP